MDGSGHAGLRELDRREAPGLEVRLLWSPWSQRLVVLVVDELEPEAFALEAGAAEARDVFEHPYAYRDRRRSIYHRRGGPVARNLDLARAA